MGSGSVALVTGAGRGIGRTIAVRLADEGFDVGVTARSAEQLTETAELVRRRGRRVVRAQGDVTSGNDVARVVAAVTAGLGPIDVLVNNAGYLGRYDSFADSEPDDWWRVVETNVRGPALYTRAVLPTMLARRGGHIININSLQGSRSGGTSAAYSVSKAALMRLTDSVAAETTGTGVTVVDLSPGLVRTSMTDERPDLDSLPTDAWMPPEAAAGHVAALVSGRYDALHGRFVHVSDDLDALLRRAVAHPDGRVLRLMPAGPDDPLSDA